MADGKLAMGPGTLEVPVALFALNRKRLAERMSKLNVGNAIVVLQGGDELPFYDTDTTYSVFRQESYFMWTFGALEPGCYGAVVVETGASVLFVPRLDPSYEVWSGPILSPDDFKNKYGVDFVYYVDEIEKVLKSYDPSKLLTLSGVNSDSGLAAKDAQFEGIEHFEVDKTSLYNQIADLRVYKTDYEMEVMKYVTEISSAAHRKVMLMARAGKTEYQCESCFLDYCYTVGGCRFVSYTCICCSGPNAAILHYGHAAAPNNRLIRKGDILSFDMGANYFGYAADITCSFPESGKFSDRQKIVYNAVLEANRAVFSVCKPGILWTTCHQIAIRTILSNLREAGLLKGDVQAMVDADLGLVFMPHGLGHFIGLDVHDVGGYLQDQPARPKSKSLAPLRMARELAAGMCITIEPGCYFIDRLLDEALADSKQSHFLVPEVLNQYRGFGGVRIEDDVYITEDGCVNMTKVPRTVEEVENWIAGKDTDDKYQ